MCTGKYRPVLSSERAPYIKKEVQVRLKNMQNLVMSPKGRPDPTPLLSPLQQYLALLEGLLLERLHLRGGQQ
jgi:hypothetical protein